MGDINTVTIPLDEYFELRRKAEENVYIADRLGCFEQRQLFLEERLAHLEGKVTDLHDRP